MTRQFKKLSHLLYECKYHVPLWEECRMNSASSETNMLETC
jgi:hypothetical protein